MASKHPHTAPERTPAHGTPPQPDVNAGAPRPSKRLDPVRGGPDMDHPPAAHRHDQPGFDRATTAADREARAGTLPGPEGRGAAQSQRGAAGAQSGGATAARKTPPAR